MGSAASGGPPRNNQPRRTPRRLSFLRLDSSSASLVYPHSAFGQTTEGLQILRSSFTSRHVPLNLRVPSASSPRFSRGPTCSSPVLGFNVRAAWPSHTFGVRTEGGVPNNSPSEPRSDPREGRGFDLMGAAGSRSTTLRDGRRDGGRRSTVRAVLQKMLHILAEETKKLFWG
jgi:hypothetical protein